MSFKQGLINFMGGVNDTMNLPAVVIGDVGAFLSPRGSKAEYYFKDFADYARHTSDMGQDYNSLGYTLGRISPALAAAPLMPLMAGGASLTIPETLGIMVPALGGQESFWVGLPSGMNNRERVRASFDNYHYAPGTSNTGRKIIYKEAVPTVQYVQY